MGAMSIEANKGVVRAFIEIWNSGDLDQPEDLMADECALTVSGETISCGPSAATRAIATRWRAAFLDYRFDLLDLIAEGDKAVARIAWAGVQKKGARRGSLINGCIAHDPGTVHRLAASAMLPRVGTYVCGTSVRSAVAGVMAASSEAGERHGSDR
jgi:predicted ester cyclase